MADLLAMMAVREPLRWQQPSSGHEAVFFPGGDGERPLIGPKLRTVKALWRRGFIELATGVLPTDSAWDVLPSASGYRSLDPADVLRARKWNDERNRSHHACRPRPRHNPPSGATITPPGPAGTGT